MVVKLGFCDLDFFDNYVISTINEGQTVTIEKKDLIVKTVLDYYQDRYFIYITRRIHAYSVNPMHYSSISKVKNLAGFIVISSTKSSIKNALFESMFLDKPFEIFEDIEDAILWADSVCNMKKKIEK